MNRFYDGKTWTNVLPEKKAPVELKKRKNPLSFFRRRSPSSSSNDNIDTTPVAPVIDGNGKILVTIPSFRGTHARNQTALYPGLGTNQARRITSCLPMQERTLTHVFLFFPSTPAYRIYAKQLTYQMASDAAKPCWTCSKRPKSRITSW